jgi:hypothetical protein
MTEANDVKQKRGPKPKAVEPVQQVSEQDKPEVDNATQAADLDATQDADKTGNETAETNDTNVEVTDQVAVKAETSSSQAEIEQIEPKTEQQGQEPEVLPEVEHNNENIVVVKVANPVLEKKNGLVVEVKNNGASTVFEPLSKTSIMAGQTAQIECSTRSVKQSVLNNLKQLKNLGKNLEVLSND